MRHLLCNHCGHALSLSKKAQVPTLWHAKAGPAQGVGEPQSTYLWRCSESCGVSLNTHVLLSQDIRPFERLCLRDDQLFTAPFAHPVTDRLAAGVRVYMPHILGHFITCHWGPCYASIHRHVLVPLLDNVAALDYVLRSLVILPTPDVQVGQRGARIFPELLRRLGEVRSTAIREYLLEEFDWRESQPA